jgi:murein DD-endopeptidase MepM/ murein hydrolase activator NlpD
MDGAYGNRIDIYNLDMKLKISYCHVFRSSVKTGDRVKPGQIIGIS